MLRVSLEVGGRGIGVDLADHPGLLPLAHPHTLALAGAHRNVCNIIRIYSSAAKNKWSDVEIWRRREQGDTAAQICLT